MGKYNFSKTDNLEKDIQTHNPELGMGIAEDAIEKKVENTANGEFLPLHKHMKPQSYYDGYNDPETLRKGISAYSYVETFKSSTNMLHSLNILGRDQGDHILTLEESDKRDLLAKAMASSDDVCRVKNKTIMHKGKEYKRYIYFAASFAYVIIEKKYWKVLVEKTTHFTTQSDSELLEEEIECAEKEVCVEKNQRTMWQWYMLLSHK